jgi:hypothetical protein
MKKREKAYGTYGMKVTHICTTGAPRGEEMEKDTENIFNKIAENLSHLGRGMDIQIHEVQRTLIRLSSKRYSSRHIIIRLSKVKDKERILKAARETVTYKGISLRLTADFSAENFQARRK